MPLNLINLLLIGALAGAMNNWASTKAKLEVFWKGFTKVTERLKQKDGTPMLLKLKVINKQNSSKTHFNVSNLLGLAS